jgi:hypothetical protein
MIKIITGVDYFEDYLNLKMFFKIKTCSYFIDFQYGCRPGKYLFAFPLTNICTGRE